MCDKILMKNVREHPYNLSSIDTNVIFTFNTSQAQTH